MDKSERVFSVHAPVAAGETVSPHHGVSLRLSLYLLVVVSLVPSLLLAAYLAMVNYRLEQQQIYSESALVARKISARLDREFTAIESGLKVLATSEHLASGNLRKFHDQAREAVRSQIVYNYILTDERGAQVLNTLLPFGSALPTVGTPVELVAVFREGQTVLTNLFIGPVVKKPVIAIGVPVRVDGHVRYSLNVGIDVLVFNRILDEEHVPETWLLVILDSKATIVARTRNPEQFVGQKAVPEVLERMMASQESTLQTQTKEGTPVISSHYRSALWNWIVAVGVDKVELDQKLGHNLHRLMVWGGLALLLGLGGVAALSNWLMRTLEHLNSAARAIAQGRSVALPQGLFSELDDIGFALRRVSYAFRKTRHRAYHDTLTGLANRDLFLRIARSQIARSQREGKGVGVLTLDLDLFKPVNDTYGHAQGDCVLKEVAHRLTTNIRNCDLAARIGGDEFLVLVAPGDVRFAVDVARRLVHALSAPYAGVPIPVSASAGIAVYPDHGENIELLMQRSDAALYAAKRAGRRRATLWSQETLPRTDTQ